MSDYERISKAIAFIEKNVDGQPGLDEIAAHMHLSPYHFQRLFSRWAGITPKRFLQALTLEKAKALMQESKMSVLDVAETVGLSSGSRLYDHFVHIEAMTPSEYKQKGTGLVIQYGTHSSPFGKIFIALTDRGICKLAFFDEGVDDEYLNNLKQQWPNAKLISNQKETASFIDRIFHQQPSSELPLSLLVRGTNFQINVWRALLTIPPGQVTSYKNVAHFIGKPKASRAVGLAVGANPLAYIIPCHRVIQQSGKLGGYRWGVTRKQVILAWETAKYDVNYNEEII